MKRNIYFNGALIDRTDELQMDCINTIGTTFDEAAKPENQDLCTAISHLTEERISRFAHIHQNADDLHKKQDMTRMLCQKVAGCIQRCMGIDATNAIYNVISQVLTAVHASIGGIVGLVVGLVVLVFMIIGIIKAATGKYETLPLFGDMVAGWFKGMQKAA